MKGVIVKERGVFVGNNLSTPKVGTEEILIEVYAAGLNRADLLQVKGLYVPPKGASEILGLECAGIVKEVGSSVKGFKEGDRVIALVDGGAQGEYVACNYRQAAFLPEELSFVEGAALLEGGVTAWLNLALEGDLKPSQRVLITAAASGIGIFSVQIANFIGAEVFVAGRSMDRLDKLFALGAKGAFLLNEIPEMVKRSHNLSFDLILDMVAGRKLEDFIEVVAPKGKIVVIGLLGGNKSELDLAKIMRKMITIKGSVLRYRSAEEKGWLIRSLLNFIQPYIEKGDFKIIIDKVFDIDNASDAYDYLMKGGVFGKVVIRVKEENR